MMNYFAWICSDSELVELEPEVELGESASQQTVMTHE